MVYNEGKNDGYQWLPMMVTGSRWEGVASALVMLCLVFVCSQVMEVDLAIQIRY